MIELLTISNVVIGVSILINFILIIGIRNLLIQNEQLEDKVVSTISDIRNRIGNTLQKMKDIDNRQVFEKDDEVGASFSELTKMIDNLNNEI
jgi:septal ring-binding cell division protein DamX